MLLRDVVIENWIGARCYRACGRKEREGFEQDSVFPKAAQHSEMVVVAPTYALACRQERRELVDFA